MSWNNEQAVAIIDKWQGKEGALVPVLREMQDTFGYIDSQVIPTIVEKLKYARAEVHGVISFYHDFHSSPKKSKVLQICCAEACQAMGSRALVRHIEQKYQTKLDSDSETFDLSVEKAYCFGNCACAPAVMFQGEVMGRVTESLVDELITQGR